MNMTGMMQYNVKTSFWQNVKEHNIMLCKMILVLIDIFQNSVNSQFIYSKKICYIAFSLTLGIRILQRHFKIIYLIKLKQSHLWGFTLVW